MRASGALRARDRPPLVLGIDLGATKVVSALVADGGKMLHTSGRVVHANDGPRAVLETLLESARRCLSGYPVHPKCVGVGVAAQVDPETGLVIHAPNLRWRNIALGPWIEEALGLPVYLVNDARAATYAEWRCGAGRGFSDIFGLSLGTGVGGSAVLGGRLVEGSKHAAGEVGHVTIVSGGRPCHCPNSGCLEAYVGGWAIAERAREEVRAHPRDGVAIVRAAGSLRSITAESVFRAGRHGDPLAERITRETEGYLADGVVGVVNSFNPAALVLVGGLVSGLPRLVDTVRDAIRARCQPPAARCRVYAGELGEAATLVGAAVLARERFVERRVRPN